MKDVSNGNFGLLIAFLLPGFVVLWGVSYFSATVRFWLSGTGATPTVGGFLYVTLASVAAGVTVSTVRWLVIDTLHHHTGIPRPRWDFAKLPQAVPAFESMVEAHYRFYQFHANSLIALFFVYVARRIHQGIFTAPVGLFDVGFALLSIILFVGSRDTFTKYQARVSQFLGTTQDSPCPHRSLQKFGNQSSLGDPN
jgi:hypothetical protein